MSEQTPARPAWRRFSILLRVLKWTLLAAFSIVVALTLYWGFPGGPPYNRSTAPPGPPYEYVGAIHCHTTFSDGGKPFAEVAAIAGKLGLDFLIVTDHNTLAGLPLEGMYSGCRVMVGSEITTDHGHLLGLGIPDTDYVLGGPAIQTVREVRLLGGVSVIAHPYNGDADWAAPPEARADAIEIFNGDSAWRKAPLWKVFLGLPAYRLNPARAFLNIMDDTHQERALWDSYLKDGPMTGLAGGDCHGRLPVGRFAIPFPGYEGCLSVFPVHILTDTELKGDVAADRPVILDAIKRGRCYVSVSPIGPAGGFRFAARPEGEKAAEMGASLTVSGPVMFSAELPAEKPVRFVLLRDGEVIQEEEGRRLKHTDSRPGVYRVEVYAGRPGSLAGRAPWIVSNPIRVDRPAKPDLVSVLPSCPAGKIFADFEDSEDGFKLHGDPVTAAPPRWIERVSPGAEGTAHALKLSFDMAKSGEGVYWAIASIDHRNLGQNTRGISFYMRADRRLRIKIFLHDDDPLGPEGHEWFADTFMVSPEWRCIPIEFAKLRPISAGQDGKLDPTNITGIYLLGDTEVLKRGTSGTVWLDEMSAWPPPETELSKNTAGGR